MNSSALFTFSAFCTRIRGCLLYLPREVSPAGMKTIISSSKFNTIRSKSTHNFLNSQGMYNQHHRFKEISDCTYHKLNQSHTIRQISDKRGHRWVSLCFEFGIQPAIPVQRWEIIVLKQDTYHLQNVLCCVSRERLSAVSIVCMCLRKEETDEILEGPPLKDAESRAKEVDHQFEWLQSNFLGYPRTISVLAIESAGI